MSKQYRVKTEHEGVYLRTCARRILPDGTRDQCYDIVFKVDGISIWEKAGYTSEGVTLEDAVRYRAERKALLSQPRPSVKNIPTINQIWKRYCRRYPDAREATYAHIARKFGETRACDISHDDLEAFREELARIPLAESTVKIIVYQLIRIVTKGVEWCMLSEKNAPIARPRERKITRRIKTDHTGVYFREARRRIQANGKPDICWDIHYKLPNGRDQWEKVGWVSEGYTVRDAVELYGMRIKALRHPELQSAQPPSAGVGGTIGELWKKYEELCLPIQKAPGVTQTAYRYIKKRFSNVHATRISRLDVEQFREELLAAGLSKAYVNTIVKLLGALINKGVEWGVLGSMRSPTSKMGLRGADNPRERFLTRKEALRLLDGLFFISPEVCLIAETSLRTGMRIGEILNLKVADVDIGEKIVYVDGKTGKRQAYLPDDFAAFFARIQDKRPGDYVFSHPSGAPISRDVTIRAFKKVVNAMGLNDGITNSAQKVVFHTLRHTFCSWLAIRGVPLYTIGKLAGHTTPDMARRYAKLSPDAKREAIQQISSFLHPDCITSPKTIIAVHCDPDLYRWCRGDSSAVAAALRHLMRLCPTPEAVSTLQ